MGPKGMHVQRGKKTGKRSVKGWNTISSGCGGGDPQQHAQGAGQGPGRKSRLVGRARLSQAVRKIQEGGREAP